MGLYLRVYANVFFFQGRFNLTVLASGRQVDGISSINNRV